MEVITGVIYHSVGASCAAMCYTPQKKVAKWSWQSYWLVQAAVCWLLLPLVIAWLTIPQLGTVLREAPADAMIKTFVLGVAYGIGGTAFGMAIRYVGFSLTYAIAVGISCVLGTLLPPLVHGQLTALFSQNGASWIMAGIIIGALGIALCGVAGRYKENDLKLNATTGTFSLAKGLPLCLLAGVLSAVYGFSIDQGEPIAAVAAKYGSGNFRINIVYIFSNTGAFLSTLIYCIYLHRREKTFGEYRQAGSNNRLLVNFMMAILTGCLWYSQFFFYGLGHVRMGKYQYSSWAIHMIMLVLFSSVAGLLMREWVRCSNKTIATLVLALIILVTAVLALTYGNYLGSL
ncbi:rhamnose:proton symporter [Niastella koreensis]|uniref:RhaT l-rhamnose-proton symport 2 n=2 Tax=Niastella koreensis TaxID=354356 RepID=G8TNK9_NIAKG|nr:L-rhamnose/proton symporter RhaT [Niastella koreensis]AEV99926.1 RhaT l-rhamnose-proton symport 2 [Niastella koreensis GR20-10]OQP51467.1 rhamnose:proton symporter [Niastella koreensis]